MDKNKRVEISMDDDIPCFTYSTMPTTRPNIRVLNHKVEPIVAHQIVPNPVVNFDEIVPALKKCVGEASRMREPNFCVPEQFEPVRASFVEVVNEFERILRHDYIPVNVREKQMAISKAFSCPLVSWLNREVATFSGNYTVLIVGSGKGKDIPRFLRANNSISKLVCIDPNEEDCAKLKEAYPYAKVYEGTFASRHGMALANGPFDVILFNMSFHYVFGVKSGFASAQLLPSLLTARGKVYGSYVDIPSVKASSMAQFMKSGNSVQFISESRRKTIYGEKPLNGIASVSMAGVIWDDPYIMLDQLYEMFADVPIALNVYHGSTMVKGTKHVPPLYQPPPFFEEALKRPELTMYRAVIMHKDCIISGEHIKNPCTQALRPILGTGLAERSMATTYNKGIPLQPYECQFIVDSMTVFADKKDGKMGKLVYSHKSIEVITAEGAFKIPGFVGPQFGDFMLQVEVMPVRFGMASHAKDSKDALVWLVATDVLVAPWGASGSFMSRWLWLQETYRNGNWPFVLQDWIHPKDCRVLELLGTAEEGVVVQSLLAPPGEVKGGAGSARYVKRRYTIDVRDGKGGISEMSMHGEYVRPRPDKMLPNPKHVVEKIRSAVDYHVFELYVLAKFFCVPGSDWRRLVVNIAQVIPPKDWRVEDQVLFYNNRHNVTLVSVNPPYVDHLVRHLTNYASSIAQEHKADLPGALIEPVADDYAQAVFSDVRDDGEKDGRSTGKRIESVTKRVVWKPDMYEGYQVPDFVVPGVLTHEWPGWVDEMNNYGHLVRAFMNKN